MKRGKRDPTTFPLFALKHCDWLAKQGRADVEKYLLGALKHCDWLAKQDMQVLLGASLEATVGEAQCRRADVEKYQQKYM
ncbi:hypothetical protein [Enterococcus gallinarum]|uniref:hypothetical protein n=1 Tax=Enterococcus gallinarum TaxID=1353 RepID=UPI000A34E60D|nr:hypothetical protein [Enterococcus gallinarum]MCB7448787.1 hypothetical protein [Enterococcus gallinarum]MDT2723878.1 hypothetical protein [Enterococcus gallinarum]TXW63054.1 hypothetical protein D4M64_04630 [Enterococcus gallinarum]TXX14698.1 hypothetical protein D4M42_07105 [Enterococcus gallinarum]